MSAIKRPVWILPVVLVSSWLAVRALAAAPAPDQEWQLGEPQPSLAGHAIVDPSLRRLIARFAAEARSRA